MRSLSTARCGSPVWMMVGMLLFGCAAPEPEPATTDDGTSSGSAGSTSGGPSSTTSAGQTSATTAASTTGNNTTSTTGAAGSSGGEEATDATTTASGDPWIEVGWGIDEFNPFDDSGAFPAYLGPQGLYMFTVPVRGGGFPLPADPYDYEHPDMPYIELWLDVDGYNDGPTGHFAELTDYVLPMSPDRSMPGTSQYISVWIPIPDTLDPVQLEGTPAQLHVELLTGPGDVLTADHDLVVGEVIDSGAGG